MPEELEKELWATVNRDHPDWSDKRKRAYVFGVLRDTGWEPSHQKKKLQIRKKKKLKMRKKQ